MIAQGIGVGAVIQDKEGAVCVDARDGALGIRRSHTHLGVAGSGAHAIGNGAGKCAPGLRRPQCCNGQTDDERPHVGSLVPGRHDMSGRRARIHDPNAALAGIFGQA